MVPEPSRKLAPRLMTWPADQPFRRVFHLERPPAQFNPGTADCPVRGRFHFFRDANEVVVPVIYGAETDDCAIAETILQMSAQRSRRGLLRTDRLSRMAIASIHAMRDLSLIELYGPGLQKLRLLPEEITSTSPRDYTRTIAWAKALHTGVPEAHGLIWMSHQFNTSKALMLFGDRVESELLVAKRPLSLSAGRGRALVERAATRAGITIV